MSAQADLQSYLRVFWRWKFLFLAFLIGVPLAAYLVVSREAKVYQSSVLLQENGLTVDTSLFTSGAAPTPGASPAAETLGGEARVIDTPRVARLAAPHLNPSPSDPNSLLNHVTASGDPTTGFITVTANASTPKRAADIANAFGKAVVALRNKQAIGLLTTAIDQLSAELAGMKPKDVGREQLSAELQRLRALRAAQGDNAQILQAAVPNGSPISPQTAKIVALAAFLGLLLGIGAVFLAEAADRRIRHPETLEELTGLPLLAVVPRNAFSEEKGGNRGGESFHMLRSTLMFFNVDRPLTTVLIASPIKGEGKTTVATRLSVATAQGGRNVILIDADLRRPQASSRLRVSGEAVQPGHGLAAVLSGQSSLESELVDVPLNGDDEHDAVPPELQGRLRILPAGGTPPNPSELLASRRMRELLSEAAERSDLVVIDTNPLLSVSDALPLLECVSGVVLIGRLHYTTKDAVKRLQKTISNTSATVLGVVATGAKGGIYGRYGYGSGYGYYGYTSRAYGTNGNSNGKRRAGGLLPRGRTRNPAPRTGIDLQPGDEQNGAGQDIAAGRTAADDPDARPS